MLKVPKLDDLTYEQMMQRAVSRIPSMTEEWTDFNHHDPGITVLQMYAWLTDMLDYYMSATGLLLQEKTEIMQKDFPGNSIRKQQSGSALKNHCFRGMAFISAWKRMSEEILLTTLSGCAISPGRFIQSRAGWK